mmetsp:Transcript_115137/g.365817  ORF Transcript_115137/g.365817 Transcript_115137/m.365817 type:complete len:144 (-) Transcript_115137:193-624(-)
MMAKRTICHLLDGHLLATDRRIRLHAFKAWGNRGAAAKKHKEHVRSCLVREQDEEVRHAGHRAFDQLDAPRSLENKVRQLPPPAKYIDGPDLCTDHHFLPGEAMQCKKCGHHCFRDAGPKPFLSSHRQHPISRSDLAAVSRCN